MARNLIGILAVFAVGLGLVALTFSASAEAPADFTFINGTEPKSLDPGIMTGQPEGRIADAIFDDIPPGRTDPLGRPPLAQTFEFDGEA